MCACICAAGEGERVSLGKNTVKARNSVESWLGSVESAMVSSLRRLAKQGMASYPEEPRTDWVLQQPAQLVIAVSQVFWCAAVEEALRSNIPVQKLADIHEVGVPAASLSCCCVGLGSPAMRHVQTTCLWRMNQLRQCGPTGHTSCIGAVIPHSGAAPLPPADQRAAGR